MTATYVTYVTSRRRCCMFPSPSGFSHGADYHSLYHQRWVPFSCVYNNKTIQGVFFHAHIFFQPTLYLLDSFRLFLMSTGNSFWLLSCSAWTYRNLVIRYPLNGHLVHFQFGAVIKLLWKFLCTFFSPSQTEALISLGFPSRSGIARLLSNISPMFKVFRFSTSSFLNL